MVSTSIKIAGDDFDEAIVRYMRKKHNLLIGERTAEDIKIRIGSCFPLAQNETMDVRGRNLVTGLPKTVAVSSEETEEALREGKVLCYQNRIKQIVAIPACIQKELLSFTERNGIASGPVFRTRSGRAINRTYVPILMKPVCEAARIPDGRANPQALRKLYLSTRAGIESNIALLVEQAMERMMEQEQLSIGWEEG